jgi:hypothetical protein
LEHYRPFRYIPNSYVRHLSSAIGIAISIAGSTAHVAVAQNSEASSNVAGQDRTFLSWEIQDVRDAMTDKLTRIAVSNAEFSNGTTLEASAKCDEIGVEFAFGTFSNKEPLPLSASGKEIQLRVRTDNGDTRIVRANRQYTNQTKTLFYDPDTSRAVLARSVRAPGGDSPMEKALTGWMADSTINEALAKLAQNALGTTDALTKAGSVRVELTLADGRTDVFDLNPQDQVLRSVMRQCPGGTPNHASAPTNAGPALGQYYAPSPGLTFSPPREVTIQNGNSIKVYLTDDQASGVSVMGKISILGQKAYPSRAGNFCIVRWVSNGRTLIGEVGIVQLGAVLEPSQAKACYLPYGTSGGVNLSAQD